MSTTKGWTNKWLLVSPQKACKCDWIGQKKTDWVFGIIVHMGLQNFCCVIQVIVRILAHLLHSLHWDSFYPPCLFVPDYVWKVPNPWVFLTFLVTFFKLLTCICFSFHHVNPQPQPQKHSNALNFFWYTFITSPSTLPLLH